jgi:DNA modification methylase
MTVKLLHGDAVDMLATLEAGSIHCAVTSPPYYGLRSYLPDDHPDKAKEIGLESTPDEYIARLVEVFRGVRRVLRDDGTLWVNIGDSYATGTTADRKPTSTKGSAVPASWAGRSQPQRHGTPLGLKTKDLLGIPWMLAFALRADGWYLRAEIIWAKRNCMPESVRDRPTRAHEQIFLFSKSSSYFYDAVAIEEQGDIPAGTRAAKGSGSRGAEKNVNGRPPEYWEYTGRRNKRTVWTMATKPFKEAHFATFPPELPETCIKAGTSERGCCPACGAAWERQRGEAVHIDGRGAGNGFKREARLTYADKDGARGDETPWVPKVRPTTGWSPTCACPAMPPVPCRVLDPFAGAGTTGLVADRLGRDAVLIDLSGDYQIMQRNRIAGDAPLLTIVA